jgi:hypothetical protein
VRRKVGRQQGTRRVPQRRRLAAPPGFRSAIIRAEILSLSEVSSKTALHFFAVQRVASKPRSAALLFSSRIGVLGLLAASWPRQMLESWINIHALFGLLLCGLVFSRCWRRLKHSPRMLAADIRELSRHLSRIVYLLLYVVIGVRQTVSVLNSIWHGSAVDFNPFDEHFRNGPDRASWNPGDDFQLFLARGLSMRNFATTEWSLAVTAFNSDGSYIKITGTSSNLRRHSDRLHHAFTSTRDITR